MIKVYVNGKLLPSQKLSFDTERKVVTIHWSRWERLVQRLSSLLGRSWHIATVYEYVAGNGVEMVLRKDVYEDGTFSYSQLPRRET